MADSIRRIDVIDDHKLFVAGLEFILARLGDQVTVATYSDPAVWRKCTESAARPDLVLLDFYIPGHDAAESITAIREQCPASPIVVLSSSVSPADRECAMAAGAALFIQKHSEPDHLLASLAKVLDGAEAELAATSFITPDMPGLTARQAEILMLAAKGLSNKEIARVLGISPETVKTHLKDIFQRFGLRNRMEAIGFIRQNGLG